MLSAQLEVKGARFISPLVGLVWILVVSRVLLVRPPATRAGW